MIVDLLSSHHLTRARMIAGSGEEFWVRWYPAAPGAQVFPGWSAFGSPVWEPERNEFEGPGCFFDPLIWRPKRYAAPPGLHYHGELSWFADGLPSLAVPAAADACGVPAIWPEGGLALAGASWPVGPVIESEVSEGEAPGTSVSGPWYVPSAACGCTAAGGSVTGPWYVPSPACGCGTAGSTVAGPWYVPSPACGCGTAGGTAEIEPVQVAAACGCTAAGGSVTGPWYVPSPACGCGRAGVSAELVPVIPSPACGCASPGGSVTGPYYVTAAACGCTSPGGTAGLVPVIPSPACGCGTAGGSAELVPVIPSPACGCTAAGGSVSGP